MPSRLKKQKESKYQSEKIKKWTRKCLKIICMSTIDYENQK
jgi:hypothetical protein